jgi:gliding motility-associated-like protein
MIIAPAHNKSSKWGFIFGNILALTLWCNASAQPSIRWDKTFGGERYEELNGLLVRPDGIIAAGSTQSGLTFGPPNDLSWNILITKFDFDGKLLWKHVYGGDQDDRLWNIIPTSDGGYLAGGSSYSGISGNKTEANRGVYDVWILKLDAQGVLQWDKTFGGDYQDELFAMQEKPGGGYYLGCNSWSDASGDKSENSRGIQDFWLISTDAWGNKLWDKTIGGNSYEQINDLELAPDGAIYLSGGTVSDANTGEMGPTTARGGMDFFLVKFDPETRTMLWSKRYGGTGEDYPYSLVVMPDGNLLLGGRSSSPPGPPMSDNNGKDAPFYGGNSDFWVIKLDKNGNKIKDWSFGGDDLDDLYAIQPTEKGGFILGGVTGSGITGNKGTGGLGGYDYWIVGVDADFNMMWDKTLGGTGNDALTRIALMKNGSMILGGHSDSNKGLDKSEDSQGLNDFWLVATLCDLEGNLIVDQTPCSRNPVKLDATQPNCPGCCYKWNTGSRESAIELPAGTHGTYFEFTYDPNFCIFRDTVAVSSDLPPSINLGTDTTALHGTVITIGSTNLNNQYLWNTGQTTPQIQITDSGTYTVTVTDVNGCTITDMIRVVFKKSGVWVPNAFSPNLDGINDNITIYSDESVKSILHFQIFDRWGDLIYSKTNVLSIPEYEGWDGTFRHKQAPIGVYTWTALVEYNDGTQEALQGDITLVR